MKRSKMLFRGAVALLLVGTVGGWLISLDSQVFANGQPGSGGSPGGTTYSGQATVVDADVLGLATVTLSDTGPLPSSGGALEESLLEVEVPELLSAEVLHASTVGQGDRTRSEASVATLNLTAGGHTISAGFLLARAEAICTPRGETISGDSEIAELVVDGTPITVGAEPNQTIPLPNGEIVINEQTSNGPGDITVTALHVVLPGIADVAISSAHADIACVGKPVCEGEDFVTGGGWITTPSGARANFAVAGGIKNGQFWGHLMYIDHETGMKVKGTEVTGYAELDPTTRFIEGMADINRSSGFTYEVEVTDNGEPGRNDVLTIRLSNGYEASEFLDGGNIQLHTPCR
ncbi:MAG: hypothetical protein HY706_08355 [Candidatus Hydrogenedentes bacterium]|nr:hypothetical protein [Candidatus Hydrogenedentota bacterium]